MMKNFKKVMVIAAHPDDTSLLLDAATALEALVARDADALRKSPHLLDYIVLLNDTIRRHMGHVKVRARSIS